MLFTNYSIITTIINRHALHSFSLANHATFAYNFLLHKLWFALISSSNKCVAPLHYKIIMSRLLLWEYIGVNATRCLVFVGRLSCCFVLFRSYSLFTYWTLHTSIIIAILGINYKIHHYSPTEHSLTHALYRTKGGYDELPRPLVCWQASRSGN